jgi:hypothetical protein
MYVSSSFGVSAALIAGVLGALELILISGNVGHPSESEMREALERELDGFVTPGAMMCGLVPKGANRAGAIECIQTSIMRKDPFLAAFQEQGEDSDIWSGLVGGADGELRWLVLDSSPYGEPQTTAEYSVTSRACLNPEFAQVGAGAIRCNNMKSPNKRIEFAPYGRPTRKQQGCLLAAHLRR